MNLLKYICKWTHRNEQEPDPKDRVLGLCKACGFPHLIYHDYDEWVMPEWCSHDGHYSAGKAIDFDYWMFCPPLPEFNFGPNPGDATDKQEGTQ